MTGSFDWKKAAGSKITILQTPHPYQQSYLPLLGDFTELTGIEVTADLVPEASYFTKLNTELAGGSGTHDCFMGRQIELSVDLGGTQLIALSRGGELAREGARVVVEVATRNVHLFEAAGPAAGADGDRPDEPGDGIVDTKRIGGADGTLQADAARNTSHRSGRVPIGGSVQ